MAVAICIAVAMAVGIALAVAVAVAVDVAMALALAVVMALALAVAVFFFGFGATIGHVKRSSCFLYARFFGCECIFMVSAGCYKTVLLVCSAFGGGLLGFFLDFLLYLAHSCFNNAVLLISEMWPVDPVQLYQSWKQFLGKCSKEHQNRVAQVALVGLKN